MAFEYGVWTPQPWNGKVVQRLRKASAILAITSGPGGRLDIMKTRQETGPLYTDFDVKAYGRLEQIVLQTQTIDEVTLRARKVEGMIQIAEEDLVEGRNYDFDMIQQFRDRGTDNSAVYYDNASIGTTGEPTTGETNIVRPYRSILQAVLVDNPTGYSSVAAAATVAQMRTAIKKHIEFAERTAWSRDLVTVADPSWKSYLRDLPVDGSNGKPIWDDTNDTLLGVSKIYWTEGARAVGAVATQKPVGNPLMATGPRDLFIGGRAPFSTGNAAVPQAYLTDPTTGLGMRDDSLYFKLRWYPAFVAGVGEAFSVLERTG